MDALKKIQEAKKKDIEGGIFVPRSPLEFKG
jgi:hypothetical protein